EPRMPSACRLPHCRPAVTAAISSGWPTMAAHGASPYSCSASTASMRWFKATPCRRKCRSSSPVAASCTRISRSKPGSGTEPMDFARYAITRPVNIWILVLTCLVGGILAFFEIGRLEDPEFTIKQAIVSVQYPGATALEVEQQVTEPLESAIQQMSQIKEIRSRS